MIDALISGRLAADPKPGTAKSGSPYAVARLWVATNGADNLHVSAIAFAEPARAALLALSAGETVALAGELTPKIWTDPKTGTPRLSADMVAHAVLTAYHVSRRRAAMASDDAAQ